MRLSGRMLCGTLLFMTVGCASTGNHNEIDPSEPIQIAYGQVKAEPDAFKGQPVTFGGKVLNARRLKEGTRIEILQLPLNRSQQPTSELNKSQGRFIALQKTFLDPATVPPGTFITVTGEAAGSVTLPLDETEYTYPLVMIKHLRVWTNHEEEEAPRIRRPIGPGYYGSPYWSPYWYPWPYYW